jgi:hypothetical protein
MKMISLSAISITLIFMTLNPGLALAKSPTAAPVVVADAGGQGGNGAGGVTRGGKTMTFFTANIVVSPEELTKEEIPNLDSTINFIYQSNVFSSKIKAKLMGLLIPSQRHTYYRVPKEYFTPAILKRLLEEYARISQQPVVETELFAITDTRTSQTFLLPSFYDLRKKEEQMAVLMHEIEWMRHPNANGKQIVKLETAYQGLFENPNDPNRGYAMALALEGMEGAMRFAIRFDSRDGGSLVNRNTLRNGDDTFLLTALNLFGDAYTACVKDRNDGDTCSELALPQLLQLQNAFPKSLLLRALGEKSANKKLSLWLTFIDRRGRDQRAFFSEVMDHLNPPMNAEQAYNKILSMPLVFVESNPNSDWNLVAKSPEGFIITIK